jgi:pimeloyl-ACP methyl ester carboxylesterase
MTSQLHHTVSGAGPPLLLIHGTGGDGDVWLPSLPRLARRHRVIAYDRRAFGRSTGPPHVGPRAHAAHAADAAALLEALSPSQPALVVGWSAGAIVALHLAAEHPERVRALALVEPPLWARSAHDLGMTLGMARLLWHALRGRPREATAAFYRAVTRYRDGGNGFDALSPSLREQIVAAAPAVLAELRSGTGEDLTPERLARIGCPATLILGARSSPMFARLGDRLAQAMPGLARVTVAGVGHLMMLEAPDAFADAVAAASDAGDRTSSPAQQRAPP